MNSRIRLILCSIGLLVVLILLFAALHSPPDGVERGDFSQFIGRFHPLAVHFPIALVLLVLVIECVGLFQWGKSIRASAGFVLALATISAIAAAFLGWMLGRNGGYEGSLVIRHMWGGISLAAALVICCAVRAWEHEAVWRGAVRHGLPHGVDERSRRQADPWRRFYDRAHARTPSFAS